jgi:hypothetical protein
MACIESGLIEKNYHLDREDLEKVLASRDILNKPKKLLDRIHIWQVATGKRTFDRETCTH